MHVRRGVVAQGSLTELERNEPTLRLRPNPLDACRSRARRRRRPETRLGRGEARLRGAEFVRSGALGWARRHRDSASRCRTSISARHRRDGRPGFDARRSPVRSSRGGGAHCGARPLVAAAARAPGPSRPTRPVPIRLREVGQAVEAGDQDIGDAALVQSLSTASQNLAPRSLATRFREPRGRRRG